MTSTPGEPSVSTYDTHWPHIVEAVNTYTPPSGLDPDDIPDPGYLILALKDHGWDIVSATDPEKAHWPNRALFRHQPTGDWMLVAANYDRLLPQRDNPHGPVLSLDDPTGMSLILHRFQVAIGNVDHLIDTALEEHLKLWWTDDSCVWLLRLLPGPRSDAETLLIALRQEGTKKAPF